MRIAFVSEHASPLAALGGADAGGQNVHVAALATALAARGHEVVVHTRRDDPDLPPRVSLAAGVTVHHVDAGPPCAVPKDDLLPYMDAFAVELAAAWSRWRPDVVHAHFWMSGLAALRAARPRGIPVVHTFHALGTVKRRHQGSADTSPPGRIAAERWIAAIADALVATCGDEVRELAAMGADRSRVTVVPCGVDLDAFAAPENMTLAPLPSSRRARLLSLGRLVERKGIQDVLVALAGVPGAELVVAGGPARVELGADPEYRRLSALASSVGVDDRVMFIGRVGRSSVPSLVRSADVVVCAPWYEPFGIVPIEAMACGVPVVATGVGGMLDTVVPGVTGLIVPPRQPQALGEALRRLLGDADLRARLGRAGRNRAQSIYGWRRVADGTAAVYERLIAVGAGPGEPRCASAGRSGAEIPAPVLR